MKDHEETTMRPSALIDEWLTRYGYDKRRYTSPDAMCFGYARLARWFDGERVSTWSLMATEHDAPGAFRGLFSGLLDVFREDRANDLGERATTVEALLVVTHGEGRWAVADPDDPSQPAKEWDDLDEEFREFLEITSDPELLEKSKMGLIPCRIVNLICDTGLGAEISLFPPGQEVMVERHEQYSAECEPESLGLVDDALMSCYAFVLLIEQAVKAGESLDMAGLMRSAMSSKSDYATSMMSYLLRLMANGVESGVLDFDDLFGRGE